LDDSEDLDEALDGMKGRDYELWIEYEDEDEKVPDSLPPLNIPREGIGYSNTSSDERKKRESSVKVYIIVAGGLSGGFGSKPVDSAYKIELGIPTNWNASTLECEYKTTDQRPLPYAFSDAFVEKCGHKVVIGGGQGPREVLNDVIEFNENDWKRLPNLKTCRKLAASCFIKGKLIVAGGRGKADTDRLDSIEILEISSSGNGVAEWKKCPTNLPCKLEGHTLTVLNNNIYLIGGDSGGNSHTFYNRVWEGFIDFKNGDFDIDFKLVQSMQRPRSNHFSVAVKNKIYVFGGEMDVGKEETSSVEIFDGANWSSGPKFDFHLSRSKGDSSSLIESGIILVTSKANGIILYDPSKGETTRSIKQMSEIKIKDKRNHYVTFST